MSTYVYAGFWRRFVAFLIDSLFLSVIYLLLLIPLSGFILPRRNYEFREIDTSGVISMGTISSISSFFGYAEFALLVIGIFYHTFLESSRYQGTIGKRVLEIQVINYKGERLSFLKSLLRNVIKIISSIGFMIGYLMAGQTSKKQTLHDMIAHTLVVRKELFPERSSIYNSFL